MKRAKKKDTSAKYMISDKQLKKITDDVSSQAVHMTGMLYLAVLAEKGWSEDEIIELFETISRYINYLDDHLIKMKQVQELIESRTGIKLSCHW